MLSRNYQQQKKLTFFVDCCESKRSGEISNNGDTATDKFQIVCDVGNLMEFS